MLFFVSYSISFCFCSYLNYFLSWVFIVFYLNPRVEVNTRDLFLSVLIGNRWALSLYNPMPHFSYIPQVWNNNFCIVSRLELQIPNLGIWIFLLQLLTLKNFKPTDNWKEWHNQYLYVIHLDFPLYFLWTHSFISKPVSGLKHKLQKSPVLPPTHMLVYTDLPCVVIFCQGSFPKCL